MGKFLLFLFGLSVVVVMGLHWRGNLDLEDLWESTERNIITNFDEEIPGYEYEESEDEAAEKKDPDDEFPPLPPIDSPGKKKSSSPANQAALYNSVLPDAPKFPVFSGKGPKEACEAAEKWMVLASRHVKYVFQWLEANVSGDAHPKQTLKTPMLRFSELISHELNNLTDQLREMGKQLEADDKKFRIKFQVNSEGKKEYQEALSELDRLRTRLKSLESQRKRMDEGLRAFGPKSRELLEVYDFATRNLGQAKAKQSLGPLISEFYEIELAQLEQ